MADGRMFLATDELGGVYQWTVQVSNTSRKTKKSRRRFNGGNPMPMNVLYNPSIRPYLAVRNGLEGAERTMCSR